jgi:hypothetical protein
MSSEEEDTNRPLRALIGQAIQEWMTSPAHGGPSAMDNGIVTAWVAVVEVAAPDGARHLARIAGTGVDGDDHTTEWQRRGMLLVASEEFVWPHAIVDEEADEEGDS